MSRKPKTCVCGHNKKAHGYYYGCDRCGCLVFKPRKLAIHEADKKGGRCEEKI